MDQAANQDVVVSRVKWVDFEDQFLILLAKHHEVVSGFEPCLPYNPDVETMRQLAEQEQVLIWAAVEDGQLLAYCFWYPSMSLESKEVPVATQGFWYSTRQGLGKKVFLESLAALHDLGVQVAYPHHWVQGASGKAGEFFQKLGAVKVEVSYSLDLAKVGGLV